MWLGILIGGAVAAVFLVAGIVIGAILQELSGTTKGPKS